MQRLCSSRKAASVGISGSSEGAGDKTVVYLCLSEMGSKGIWYSILAEITAGAGHETSLCEHLFSGSSDAHLLNKAQTVPLA